MNSVIKFDNSMLNLESIFFPVCSECGIVLFKKSEIDILFKLHNGQKIFKCAEHEMIPDNSWIRMKVSSKMDFLHNGQRGMVLELDSDGKYAHQGCNNPRQNAINGFCKQCFTFTCQQCHSSHKAHKDFSQLVSFADSLTTQYQSEIRGIIQTGQKIIEYLDQLIQKNVQIKNQINPNQIDRLRFEQPKNSAAVRRQYEALIKQRQSIQEQNDTRLQQIRELKQKISAYKKNLANITTYQAVDKSEPDKNIFRLNQEIEKGLSRIDKTIPDIKNESMDCKLENEQILEQVKNGIYTEKSTVQQGFYYTIQ